MESQQTASIYAWKRIQFPPRSERGILNLADGVGDIDFLSSITTNIFTEPLHQQPGRRIPLRPASFSMANPFIWSERVGLQLGASSWSLKPCLSQRDRGQDPSAFAGLFPQGWFKVVK
jgi:hypothetical protein